MKTAIYIEDGVTQLVLTPETATDKMVLDTLHADGTMPRFAAYRGSFYECRGGWTRFDSNRYGGGMFGRGNESDNSLILRTDASKDATSELNVGAQEPEAVSPAPTSSPDEP